MPSSDPLREPLTLYVAEVSYFSGKMEGYLRYKEIPYERRVVNTSVMHREVLPATGLMKVPVVRLHDGAWLKDTTPMIDWFESHKPEPPVIPHDPVQRFISKLLEDYADEWCWRAAVYWRWCFPETRRVLRRRIGREVLGDWPLPASLSGRYFGWRQYRTFLKGDGITKKTAPHVEASYPALLDALSALLTDRPFLLGSHPSLVDFGFFGPMFRHYSEDPDPARVMDERAPLVRDWVTRLWNARASEGSDRAIFRSFEDERWSFFFRELVQNYWPFLVRNARAWRSGARQMRHEVDGVCYENLRVSHYRVHCLEVLQDAYAELTVSQRADVDALLAPHGQLEIVDDLRSGLKEEFVLPLEDKRIPLSRLRTAALYFTGTPWDMPKKAR